MKKQQKDAYLFGYTQKNMEVVQYVWLYLTIVSLYFIVPNAQTQIVFSTLEHNFGELNSYDHRFIDITVSNKNMVDGYILSVRKPSEVVYIQSRALIQKDSSLTLRFQVNPREKGKFKYTIDIYTSDKDTPHKLQLYGTLTELSVSSDNYLTACPDFNVHPIGRKSNQLDLKIVVIDAQTRQKIPSSLVSMIQNGRTAWTDQTTSNGTLQKQGIVGQAYFYVTKNGYLSAEKGTFVNNNRNQIVVELTKNEEVPNEVLLSHEELIVEAPAIVENPPTTVPISRINFNELPQDNFDASLFAPVNVVFVLDVSSSMNQGDKMELMKYSLNRLSEMIRQHDNISLVTYASRAQVLLPPTSGQDKIAVWEQTERLKAHGMTAGGEGIRLGFEQAERGFLPQGINHVFVLTDGAFNQKNYDYKKLLKKYTAKNIQLSVVGICNDSRSEVSMREIAQMGGGEYIPIVKLLDAQRNIPQAVRKMAFQHK